MSSHWKISFFNSYWFLIYTILRLQSHHQANSYWFLTYQTDKNIAAPPAMRSHNTSIHMLSPNDVTIVQKKAGRMYDIHFSFTIMIYSACNTPYLLWKHMVLSFTWSMRSVHVHFFLSCAILWRWIESTTIIQLRWISVLWRVFEGNNLKSWCYCI